MFITGIELKGFRRLIHNNINEVVIDFTSQFQLILGRNGSGKSSIMGELTPFPSHKDLYTADGYRKLHFHHRGSSYTIIDDFSIGKHSIIKDGEMLHDNMNPSMMKDMVKELFGIDRVLADILTDRKKFTTMSTNERREIIMRASGINIDLGLSILDKIKERRSYFKEYAKNLSKRLISEENNLPTDSHIEQLERRKEDILADLELLDTMANQPVSVESERDMVEKINSLQNIGKTLAYRFLDTPEILHGVEDKDGAAEVYSRLRYRLEQVENNKTELSSQIEELSTSVGKSRFSSTKEDLLKEQTFINDEISEIDRSSSGYVYVGKDYQTAVNSSQTVYEDLRGIFDELRDNSDGYFSMEKRQQNSERIIQLANQFGMFERSVTEIESQLHRHKTGDNVECPSCHTQFIPGVCLSETVLKERLVKQNEQLAKVQEVLESHRKYEAEYKAYVDQLAHVELMSRHFHQHHKLFGTLNEYNYTRNSPKHCLNILEDWFRDIGKSPRYNELLERRLKLEEEIAIVSAEDLERLRLENERLTKMEAEYSGLIDESIEIKSKMKEVVEYVGHFKTLNEWLRNAEGLVEELDQYKEKVLQNDINRFVFSCKADLNNELSNIEKEITSIQYTLLNRKRLEDDKKETDLNISDLVILHDELSPKTGLLGDVMNEFIDRFVGQMNNFIKSIWTYDLEVLPCRNKKGDLDFYFPVSVMGNKPSADVAELSTGEQHICNFVFKLLIMATYDLKDWPLYLDELAGNMDDLHRVRIMKTVYDMVVNNYCTQMFLIAHYQQQYGVFTQAEVFITNPDNLQAIPENYNTHAKIS